MRVSAVKINTISFRLLLDYPTDRDLSASEQDWVINIAALCPFEYGEAVFVARNIADIMLDDTTYYDDDSLCLMPEARIGNSESASFIAPYEESDPNIKVYPNPFSSDLTVECINK